jgi:hypothetical protein
MLTWPNVAAIALRPQPENDKIMHGERLSKG